MQQCRRLRVCREFLRRWLTLWSRYGTLRHLPPSQWRHTCPVTPAIGSGVLDTVSGTAICEPVTNWFTASARELPWRTPNASAWGIFVSEVMSQQTPVARVAPAWISWMKQWPSPGDLAAATPAEVIRAWNRLGYPRRALRLRDAAVMIRDEFDGQVPATYDELLTLPGVGDYTAAAVAAFAFNQRVVVLDTNVRRVLARLVFGTEHPVNSSATKLERQTAEQLLPTQGRQAAAWSVAVMELGALVCQSSSPGCESCPVSTQCAWVAAGKPKLQTRAKRPQRFEGTDRQVRGKLMAILRASHRPVSATTLRQCWSDDGQRDRCLDSLVADGLVEPLPRGRFLLPS